MCLPLCNRASCRLCFHLKQLGYAVVKGKVADTLKHVVYVNLPLDVGITCSTQAPISLSRFRLYLQTITDLILIWLGAE